jgi:hypothetical protein
MKHSAKYNLDDATFTNSKPAIYLVNLLRQDEYRQYNRGVATIITKALQFSKDLMKIEDVHIRRWALAKWAEDNLKLITNKNYPTKIASSMNYIITTRYRQFKVINNDL